MASIYDLLYTQPIQQSAPQPNEKPPAAPMFTAAPGPASAPAPAAPAQVAPTPAAAPAPAEKSFAEKMADPMFSGPAQTFLAAMAVPLSPWETMASRVGRSAMLMNMHRDMLAENARTEPQRREKEQLELQQARLQVETQAAQLEGHKQTNEFNAKTQDTRIASLEQTLKNAIVSGDSAAEELTMKKLEVQLKKKYGESQAAAELDRIRAATEQARASAYRDREGAKSDRIRANDAGSADDKVFTRQLQTADGLVRGRINQFKQVNPGGTQADFYNWLNEQADYDTSIGDVHTAIGLLQGQGRDPFTGFGRPAAAAGPAPIDAATVRAAISGKPAAAPAATPARKPAPVAPAAPAPMMPYAEGQAMKTSNAQAVAALNTALAAKGVEMQKAQARADVATMQRLQGEMAGITQRLNQLSK